MKPHPKLRKTIKWGGAAVTVLLVVVWIGSRWWAVEWHSDLGWLCGLQPGQLIIGNVDSSNIGFPLGWRADRSHSSTMGWWYFYQRRYDGWWFLFPLWVPISLFLLPTIIAWRLDTLAHRRARLNLCPKCNYDRAGIAAEAVCPECGAKPTESA